jgi:tRNA G18 (ribose-2'-O)-methylase SpoU
MQPNLEPHYRMINPDELPPVERNPVHVVLDNIRSAFNVGSIFRTADAGAVERMHLCGYTACPPNAKLQKTALGAFDYVPWTQHESAAAAIESLKAESVPCIAIETADNAQDHTVFPWTQPVAIVFGNEVTGIPEEHLDLCDAVVRIPMHGHKNTINVATAFGIVLFEILRQWGRV